MAAEKKHAVRPTDLQFPVRNEIHAAPSKEGVPYDYTLLASMEQRSCHTAFENMYFEDKKTMCCVICVVMTVDDDQETPNSGNAPRPL
jgi:hypothetical protein